MRINSALRYAVGLGLASLAAPALAADLPDRTAPPVFVQPVSTGYDVTIGVGPEVTNQFPGSKQIYVLPSIHVGYRKAGEPDPFYAPDDAFDIAILDNPYFRAGPAANFIDSRGSGHGYYGLHTIGDTFLVGGFAEFYPVPGHLRIRGELLDGVTGSRGLVGNVGADAIQRVGPFEFSLGPRFGFGNDRYASQYFGVTSFEASINKLVTPYTATGGLTSIGGLATVRYEFSRTYSILAFGGFSRLVDSVGSSPILNQIGTHNQFSAGATLNYTFAFKGFGLLGY